MLMCKKICFLLAAPQSQAQHNRVNADTVPNKVLWLRLVDWAIGMHNQQYMQPCILSPSALVNNKVNVVGAQGGGRCGCDENGNRVHAVQRLIVAANCMLCTSCNAAGMCSMEWLKHTVAGKFSCESSK
jgi:hypothetical protein